MTNIAVPSLEALTDHEILKLISSPSVLSEVVRRDLGSRHS